MTSDHRGRFYVQGVEVGFLQVCAGTNISIKAVCTRHSGSHDKCALFMQALSGYWEKRRACFVLLKEGYDCTSEAHAASATAAKLIFGIKPRGSKR